MSKCASFRYGKSQNSWGIFNVSPADWTSIVVDLFEPIASRLSKQLGAFDLCNQMIVLGCREQTDQFPCYCLDFKTELDEYGRIWWSAKGKAANSTAELLPSLLTEPSAILYRFRSGSFEVVESPQEFLTSTSRAVIGIVSSGHLEVAKSLAKQLPSEEIFVLTPGSGGETSPSQVRSSKPKPIKGLYASGRNQTVDSAVGASSGGNAVPDHTKEGVHYRNSPIHFYLGPLLGTALAFGCYLAIQESGMLSKDQGSSESDASNTATTIQAVFPESFSTHQQELATLATDIKKAAESAATAANEASVAAGNLSVALTSLKVNELAAATDKLGALLEEMPRYEFEVVTASSSRTQVPLHLIGKKHHVTLISLSGSIGVFEIYNRTSSFLTFEGSGTQNVTVVRQSGNGNASFLLQIRSIGFPSKGE